MTTQHTPGPWNVTGLYVRERDGGLVASIIDLWHDQKTPKAEKNANAAIIAAAPDLLAALVEMVVLYADHAQYDDEGHETAGINAALAAIARATGAAQ